METTLDEIFVKGKHWLKCISDINSVNEELRLADLKEFEAISNNQFGLMKRMAIIDRLKLKDTYTGEAVKVDNNGCMYVQHDNNIYNYVTSTNKKLNIKDVIVDSTLGEASINAILSYSVAETPAITPLNEDEEKAEGKSDLEFLNDLKENNDMARIWNKIGKKQYSNGTCGVQVWRDEYGKARISVKNADMLFVIPKKNNIEEIDTILYIEEKKDKLYVEQHSKGENIIRVYNLDDKKWNH